MKKTSENTKLNELVILMNLISYFFSCELNFVHFTTYIKEIKQQRIEKLTYDINY